MTLALMTLALVATLVTVADPNLSIAPANAAEKNQRGRSRLILGGD